MKFPKNKLALYFSLLFTNLEEAFPFEKLPEWGMVGLRLELMPMTDMHEFRKWADTVNGVISVSEEYPSAPAYATPKRGVVPTQANGPRVVSVVLESGKPLRGALFSLLSHPQVEAIP